ncbi:MAG: hypothetical protein FJ044_04840 [Candidatus Cloacimonetes bacterium]|nr:hypothetical protein [Candidatus Cloacimonadota bacterium]
MLQTNIKEHLDRISRELKQLKKLLMNERAINKEKAEAKWKNLLNTSKQISREWKGPSAVEEIREQREKKW